MMALDVYSIKRGPQRDADQPKALSIMTIGKLACGITLLMASAISIQAQSIITTVAGRGRILTGSSGVGTDVPLALPRGMAFDSKGNLYIADSQENLVFVLRPNGTMAVFAGTGVAGFSGDGGPATAAQFLLPIAVAVDASDNVYIADFHNARIRKVDRNGIITSIVGGGEAQAYHIDEIPATAAVKLTGAVPLRTLIGTGAGVDPTI